LHCTTDVAQDVFLSVEEVSTGDLDTAIEFAGTGESDLFTLGGIEVLSFVDRAGWGRLAGIGNTSEGPEE